MAPADLLDVGRWLVDQGYAVAIPMRSGFGQTGGPWSEGYGNCGNPNYARAARGSGGQIETVVKYMQGQGFVDPDRVVLVGHSAGGWGSIGAASQSPPGVVAVVAFAAGIGSYAPDIVCDGDALVAAAGVFGSTTRVPELWIYSDNDHFFGPKLARRMFDAFHASTHGAAEFLAGPACFEDGHQLVHRCPDAWHSTVAAFLKKAAGGG